MSKVKLVAQRTVPYRYAPGGKAPLKRGTTYEVDAKTADEHVRAGLGAPAPVAPKAEAPAAKDAPAKA